MAGEGEGESCGGRDGESDGGGWGVEKVVIGGASWLKRGRAVMKLGMG